MVLKNFIVFEGLDGAGTTTQIKKIAQKFPQEKLFISAEPTSNQTGLFLRKILKGEFSVNEKTSSFLFAADRCEHLYGKNGILEQISNGKVAITDRYIFSSLAYQSVTCGKELPELLNSSFPLPEILFYFKINPEISLKRVENRGEQKEIYEKIEFQKKTSQIYDSIMNEYSNPQKSQGMKIVTIDAEKSIEEISEIIYSYLEPLFR